MKKFAFIFSLIITVNVFAKYKTAESGFDLNLYLPTLQFRFQDGMDQSRSIKTGYSLNASVNIEQKYMLGIEYNIQSEKSGNSSLSINRNFSEINLIAGFNFLQIYISEVHKFNLWGTGYLGQNSNKIKTELFGQATTDQSEAETTYGVGVLAQMKLNFLLFEIDTRMMSSKSYEPQIMSVTDLRFGFQIPL